MNHSPARLVLITPSDFDPSKFAPLLADALDAADVAAVILDLATDDNEAWRRSAEVLCPIAQQRGAAFLLRDRPDLARSVGADGCHVTRGADALGKALGILKPDMIVGSGDSTTRHAAMQLGEQQPDYVLLGRLDGEEDIPATHNLVEWWSEIFQVPCVALCAGDWDIVEATVEGGADFIALRDLAWKDPAGATDAVCRAAAITARRREKAA